MVNLWETSRDRKQLSGCIIVIKKTLGPDIPHKAN